MTTGLEPHLQQAAQLCRGRGAEFSASDLTRLGEWLLSAGDWETCGMNPLQLAHTLAAAPGPMLDFFIAGVRSGLFGLGWQVICPGCRGIVFTCENFADLGRHPFHCTDCDLANPSRLDEDVKASFSLRAGMRSLPVTDEPTPQSRMTIPQQSSGQPSLTATELICRQLFRELSPGLELPRDFNMKISSLTVLTIDRKRCADDDDQSAFRVFQEHLSILRQAVMECHGSLFKTTGDTVMAVFPGALPAFQAALMILSRTAAFWQHHNVPDAGHRLGLHAGPALAISNEGRIDFFGQTVTTAARIQEQAHSGEILFTEGVYRSGAIRDLLRREGCNLELENVSLKGLNRPVPVYRLHFRA